MSFESHAAVKNGGFLFQTLDKSKEQAQSQTYLSNVHNHILHGCEHFCDSNVEFPKLSSAKELKKYAGSLKKSTFPCLYVRTIKCRLSCGAGLQPCVSFTSPRGHQVCLHNCHHCKPICQVLQRTKCVRARDA